MHTHYSKYNVGDIVSLTVDKVAGLEMDEITLGMIVGICFSSTGVVYIVSWGILSEFQHIEQELNLVAIPDDSPSAN